MRLRALEPEDLELLYAIENDARLWDTSCADGPVSRYALKQYIASAATIHECGELRLAIEPAGGEDGGQTPIGFVDLTGYNPQAARAEIGITLLKRYRGQGHGKQALLLLEDYAVERLRIHSLHAFVDEDNLPSRALFQAAGYEEVATLPHWLYSYGCYRSACLFRKVFK